MSIAALIRDMAAAGATPEAIAIAVDAIEAVNAREAERKAKRAKQKADERARKDATVARLSRDMAATVATVPPSLNDPQPELTNVQVSLNPPPYSPPALEKPDIGFGEVWEAYPRRQGGNSRKNAEASFRKAVKSGVDAATILDGVRAYAEHCDATGKTRTEFVKTTEAWLNGRFWESDWSISLSRPAPPHRQARRNTALDELNDIADRMFGNVQQFPRIAG